METYIERSPSAFERNLDIEPSLTQVVVDRYLGERAACVRIVASGSSYNACTSVRIAMGKLLGRRVDVLTPSRYVDELAYLETTDGRPFELFVSQSGRSTNVIEAAKRARSAGHKIIALTGDLESEITAIANESVEYGAGNEAVDFVTMGVLTLMEFLLLFALASARSLGRISEREHSEWMAGLRQIPRLHKEIQRRANEMIGAEAATFLAPGPAILCGDGAAYGVALEGALKWQEALKVPAMAFEPEEFIHGPNMQLTPQSIVFFIDSSYKAGRTYEIYQATREITRRSYLIARYSDPNIVQSSNGIFIDSDIDSLLTPFVFLPAVQLFAARPMRELDCEATHPLFGAFEQRVKCKTGDYEEALARKFASAMKQMER